MAGIATALFVTAGLLAAASFALIYSGLRLRRRQQGDDMSTTYPRFRPSVCFDTKKGCSQFGIQGQLTREEPYTQIDEDGTPLVYSTTVERDAKLNELRDRVANGTLEFSLNKAVAK